MAPNTSTSLFQLITPFIQSFRNVSIAYPSLPPTSLRSSQLKNFSTTSQLLARGSKRRGGGRDPRVTLIRYHLQHAKTPRPLRFSRMRALRHWTIHRAWLLHRRKRLEQEELELHRYSTLLLPSYYFSLSRAFSVLNSYFCFALKTLQQYFTDASC